jgi:hypothetical protein
MMKEDPKHIQASVKLAERMARRTPADAAAAASRTAILLLPQQLRISILLQLLRIIRIIIIITRP